ncbi:MAG: lysozyme [Cyanobacteria bacterium J06621_8]
MTPETPLQKYRQRAIKILEDKYDVNSPLLIDYAIDDAARKALGLPERPDNTPPYETWMIDNEANNESLMRTSENGVNLIKRFEGFRAEAYICPGGKWTIGYGHTKGVKAGYKISRQFAEKLLQDDLREFEQGVMDCVKVPLNQNQFDALVSFAYNLGVNALKTSTLLKRLNAGYYAIAANQFDRWVYANGEKLPGLVTRREVEKKLFLT